MRAAPTCPRCFGPLHGSSGLSGVFHCDTHGDVLPYQPPRAPTGESLEAMRKRSVVPVWLPWPLPPGWTVTGFGEAGDERTGSRASVVALSGPSPIEGPADLLVIAEEPGVGLGATFAGLDGPDPGEGFDSGPPNAKIEVMGHPTAMWCLGGIDDRAVYAGEALGNWLWTIAWPAEAGCMIAMAELSLQDARDRDFEVPFGGFSPRLED
ncbi:DUF6758 family protein [Nonomuraea sp. NPDC047529]|uniref:DUF6758 family protein n=1 Tax=unclassified Nonomuraea TaxID=2593643 RepID=UPI0033E2F1E6